MIQIKPILLGLPPKEGVSISISVITFRTTAPTATLYYEVKSELGESLANGNLELTETQFSEWGESMEYIENIVLTTLKLDRI